MSFGRSCLVIASALIACLLSGCPGPTCARGTHAEGDRCVPSDAGTDAPLSIDAPLSDAPAADAADAADAPELPIDAGGDAPVAADAGVVVDPGPPDFPATIDHLSFAVRTGSGMNDGTNANMLSLCLNATACFPMNVADVNDFRLGELDVYHFDGVALPRTAVDRVEIRSAGGTDAWRPTCLEVRFDGEPVHCQNGLTTWYGSGGGPEVTSFQDPMGLHEACTTCYPETLTHGPMVGAVGPDSARILVRTEATRRVALRLVDSARPAEMPIVQYRYPEPRDDFTATFVLTGLLPAHDYVARLEIDGVLSATEASFRTAPSADAASAFRVALGSCAQDATQPIFGPILATDPDIFLFVGDNHYGNTPDLGSLWWNYRTTLEIAPRAAMMRATSTLAIWDDHDYVGNNTNRTSPGRASALRAFQDYWANPSFGSGAQPGVFFQTSYGDVDFFMLDDRYERDPEATPSGTIVGDAQHDWLEAELMRSTATFRIIASGSIFSMTGGESWLDYPSSRNRLFDFIRDQGIGGVILVSGDIHRSHFRRIHRPTAYDIPEVVSSPLANASTGSCPASAEPDAAQLFCADMADYFVVLDVDTTRADPQVVARYLSVTGAELFRTTILRSSLE